MPSVRFKLSTGEVFYRTVDSEEVAVRQVESFFNRQADYRGEWIKVEGNAWIARSAVVAVEVRDDAEPRAGAT